MTSSLLEMQGAIVGALKASNELATLIGGRVYDMVPRSEAGEVIAQFPFVALSGWQKVRDSTDCIRSAEVTVTIDVWSRAVGTPETHAISDVVEKTLDDADLTLTANALVMISHDSTLVLRDPDGLTTHAVLDFRAFVEEP
jgi:hypothetical protein